MNKKLEKLLEGRENCDFDLNGNLDYFVCYEKDNIKCFKSFYGLGGAKDLLKTFLRKLLPTFTSTTSTERSLNFNELS